MKPRSKAKPAVSAGWTRVDGHVDLPEFWNPKVRAAECINPPAARSVPPYACKRSELLLAGQSKQEVRLRNYP
jgi:hypothetical protein